MREVKTLNVSAGVELVFEFENAGKVFLIKNFSSGSIRCSMGGAFVQAKSICINSNMFEELSDSANVLKVHNKIAVYPYGDGEVEIQCLE